MTIQVLNKTDWRNLALLLTLAATLRIIFFNGFFGSDDLVYLGRSLNIANGIWSSADYNGALRYGYNIPAGFLIWLLGLNEFTANLWPLLCSLIEIAAIYYVATVYISIKSGIFAGLIVATLPLHVALATRIHADPVVACFLTLSFVLFISAENKNKVSLYFLTGLAMGMVFWAKELAAVTLFAFATYPFFVKRIDKRWLWVIAGGVTMLFAHLALMLVIAGDLFHLFRVVLGQVSSSFIEAGNGEDSPLFYFRYLLFDIKHTWLVAYFVLVGAICILFAKRNRTWVQNRVISYTWWWLISLVAVLSFFPVSLDPIRFAMKQSNYMNLFLAPLAILAAVFFANLSKIWVRNSLLAVLLMGNVALAALEQADYRAFTANSKSAVIFARQHPDDWFLGTTNNANMASVEAVLKNIPDLEDRFGCFCDPNSVFLSSSASAFKPTGYVFFDRQTLDWGNHGLNIKYPPACWNLVGKLEPVGFGLSIYLVRGILLIKDVVPEILSDKIYSNVRGLSVPNMALIFEVKGDNLWCNSVSAD